MEYSNYFSKQLFDPINEEALNYLYSRGLKKNIIEEFKLGYVPRRNSFLETIQKKFSEEEINLTGLYYKNDKNLIEAIPALVVATLIAVVVLYVLEKKIPLIIKRKLPNNTFEYWKMDDLVLA